MSTRIQQAKMKAATGHRTAEVAVEILIGKDPRYHRPSKMERKNLLIAFASQSKTLNGAAFDIVRLDRPVNLSDPEEISASIDAISICEIKSTNQAKIGTDLRGYFFNITAAELLTAQSLGEQFRFLFVNTVTEACQELALTEIFARARGLYPAWHIRF